jgi:hypothetical protein
MPPVSPVRQRKAVPKQVVQTTPKQVVQTTPTKEATRMPVVTTLRTTTPMLVRTTLQLETLPRALDCIMTRSFRRYIAQYQIASFTMNSHTSNY